MTLADKFSAYIVFTLIAICSVLAMAKSVGAFQASWIWVLSPMWITSLIGQSIIVVDFFVHTLTKNRTK